MAYYRSGNLITLLFSQKVEPLWYENQQFNGIGEDACVFMTSEDSGGEWRVIRVFSVPEGTPFIMPDIQYSCQCMYGLTTGYPDVPPSPSGSDLRLTTGIISKTVSVLNPPSTQAYSLISTNLPMFDSEDSASIQRYIDSGDDSGALNYDDLHKPHVHYTLYIDGEKNPSLSLKAEVVEGEASGHSVQYVCSNEVQTHPFASQFNEGVAYTWEQLRSYSNIALLLVETTLIIHPVSASLDDDNDTVSVRVLSNGVYDRLKAESTSGFNTLSVVRGEPDSTFYDDSEDSYEDVDDAVVLGKNTLNKTYKISTTDLQSLGDFLFSDNFLSAIKLVNNNPIENILAIKNMPVNISGGGADVIIGNVNTQVSASEISSANAIAYHVDVGQFHIPRQMGNFLDFTSVSMTLYLPFIGFKPLSSAFFGLTLGIDYYFDSTRGECLCVLSNVKSNGKKIPLDCYQGNCGADISITASNKARREVGILSNVLEGVGDIAMGNYGGAVNSVGSALLSEHTTTTKGLGSGALMSAMTRDCFIIFDSPKAFEPSGYGKSKGYIHYGWGKIGDFKGFTTFTNVRLDGLTCTSEEVKMINSLLEEGVYL